MAALETQSAPPLLEMNRVTVTSAEADEVVKIQEVSWKIWPGEYWVVGGRPVSGKSDLLSTAGGLIRPKDGSVRLFGRDLAFLSEDELVKIRLRVGFVFAYGGRLFHNLSITENLALPLCYHQNRRPDEVEEKVKMVLRRTGLEEAAHLTPGRVARHTRQRVGLARALVLEPELLLLDNPLAGLDPLEARWWFDFLDQLNSNPAGSLDTRMTLVITTDDLQPWSGRASQFGLINDGRLWILGGRAELPHSPHRFLREWLATETEG